LEKRANGYIRDFGHRANFRAALHCGPVAIGELGTVKMEIAFLGDTMNTAARLQQACRDTGQRVLASAALVNRLAAMPASQSARSAGFVCAARKTKSSSTRSPPLYRQPVPAARSEPFPLEQAEQLQPCGGVTGGKSVQGLGCVKTRRRVTTIE
jgi:hypothetical protein